MIWKQEISNIQLSFLLTWFTHILFFPIFSQIFYHSFFHCHCYILSELFILSKQLFQPFNQGYIYQVCWYEVFISCGVIDLYSPKAGLPKSELVKRLGDFLDKTWVLYNDRDLHKSALYCHQSIWARIFFLFRNRKT